MIRDAIESDLPCLAAAMVRLQMDHVRGFPDIYRPFDASDAMSHLATLLKQSNAIVRVAEHECTVVGHVVFLIESKPQTMFTHAQRYGHIPQIEVEPAFRRGGYGRSLLTDCELLAESYDLRRIVLDVWGFNHSAKCFFESLGYEDFGSKMFRTI